MPHAESTNNAAVHNKSKVGFRRPTVRVLTAKAHAPKELNR